MMLSSKSLCIVALLTALSTVLGDTDSSRLRGAKLQQRQNNRQLKGSGSRFRQSPQDAIRTNANFIRDSFQAQAKTKKKIIKQKTSSRIPLPAPVPEPLPVPTQTLQQQASEATIFSRSEGEFLSATIDNYPGYQGAQIPRGTVSVRFNDDDAINIKATLSGLEASCQNCGIYIHNGKSCSDAALVGGTHWKNGQVQDPWNLSGGAVYNTNAMGSTETAFTVYTGYNMEETIDHAVVIYDQSGAPIGCGVLQVKPSNPFAILSSSISSYPSYAGILNVQGSVTVQFFEDETFQLFFEGSGLESMCTKCGVHIHEGTTCDNEALVGGHHWDNTTISDPWVADQGAFYNTNDMGSANRYFSLFSGKPYLENVGHSVVVHAQDGTRIGCGILQTEQQNEQQDQQQNEDKKSGKRAKVKNDEKKDKKDKKGGSLVLSDILSADIKAFQDYQVGTNSTANSPDGIVSIRFNEDVGSFHVKANIYGLEADCNNCAIRIHEATSCASSTNLGSTFYDGNEIIGGDPWNATNTTATYSTTSDGYADAAFTLYTGRTMEENKDRAVVIYKADGTPIGCGILNEETHEPIALLEAKIERYPNYTGAFEMIMGLVEVNFFLDEAFQLSFQGLGLQANCLNCGVHIHEGTTCDNEASVGGHYWEADMFSNPWVPEQGAFYTTSADGVSDRSFYLYSGKTYQENDRHAVVVHAQDGTRIGCGVLKATSLDVSTTRSAGKDKKDKDPKENDVEKAEKKDKKDKKDKKGGSLVLSDILSADIKAFQDYQVGTNSTANSPDGIVSIRFNEDVGSFHVKANIYGLEADCNNCAIRIHEATSCASSTNLGSTFYDGNEIIGGDPWNATNTTATYSTTSNGYTGAAFTLYTGRTMEENKDRAVVIYKADGTPIGCGILNEETHEPIALLEAKIERYPNFTELSLFEGDVQVTFFLDESFELKFSGTGLEANCYQCGVHIHEGMTCDNEASVGGHYWEADMFSNPWVPEQGAFYTTSKEGVSDRSFYLYSGKTYQENVRHAVVIHAQDGTRIGCGILQSVTQGSVGRRIKQNRSLTSSEVKTGNQSSSLRHKLSRAKGLRTKSR